MKYLYHVIHNNPHWIVLDDSTLDDMGEYDVLYDFSVGSYSRGYSLYFEKGDFIYWGDDTNEVDYFDSGTPTQLFCKAHNLSDEETFFFFMVYGDYLPKKRKDVHPIHDTILHLPRYRTLCSAAYRHLYERYQIPTLNCI